MVSGGPSHSTDEVRRVMDLMFASAHTTHAFSDHAVDPAIIAAVYDDIKWAPTQMNSQPLRLTLVHSPAARHRLAPHMYDGNRPKTLAAPLTILAAWDPMWHTQLPLLAPHKIGAREKLAPDAQARHEIGQRSALLQIGYLIVGLRGHGLQVGPMTGFDAHGVDEAFHAATGWKTAVIINVGWKPADDAAAIRQRAGRLSFDDAAQIL